MARNIENLFVCAGAQKAGTTWLAKTLARHPDVFFTPVKEIHYFDHAAGLTAQLSDRKRRSRHRKYYQRLLTQWHRAGALWGQREWYRAYMRDPVDDAWYASLFEDRQGRLVAGEATPEYAIIGAEGFRHLKRVAPRVRILYIMRNPVTRAWSQILHLCRSERRDAAQMGPEELVALTRSERFEALADYIGALDAIAAVFPKDQLWSGFYEDVHADRLAALEQICAFIGVGFAPDSFPGLARRYNVSQRVDMPEAVRAALRERYGPLALDVRDRIGRVPDAWQEEFSLPAAVREKKRKTPVRK